MPPRATVPPFAGPAQYESGQFDRARTTAKPMLKQGHPNPIRLRGPDSAIIARGAWTRHASSSLRGLRPHRTLRPGESCWYNRIGPGTTIDALPASTGPGRICHPFTDAAAEILSSPRADDHPQSTSGSIECVAPSRTTPELASLRDRFTLSRALSQQVERREVLANMNDREPDSAMPPFGLERIEEDRRSISFRSDPSPVARRPGGPKQDPGPGIRHRRPERRGSERQPVPDQVFVVFRTIVDVG